ncbi:hypothetical protein [Saccharopolyspora sp. ASAGF58]|uniref:hypothetical protein n=1 Tax=Saccharopolyspora sp. ASAGF58 TaxID=2719023 RepID=UPI00144010B6|nr:hypothetical protein [Saccharopolyspora sp. ASAGF58]QIZ38661.1 hypothetical protein FDZ84_34280 [Saccharopolyspora sp. ASAGF58]
MADFGSLYGHAFARVAVGMPAVAGVDPELNADRILDLARRAASDHAVLTLFPELGLSSYSIDDLFHQDALLDAVLSGLHQVMSGAEMSLFDPYSADRPAATAEDHRSFTVGD